MDSIFSFQNTSHVSRLVDSLRGWYIWFEGSPNGMDSKLVPELKGRRSCQRDHSKLSSHSPFRWHLYTHFKTDKPDHESIPSLADQFKLMVLNRRNYWSDQVQQTWWRTDPITRKRWEIKESNECMHACTHASWFVVGTVHHRANRAGPTNNFF